MATALVLAGCAASGVKVTEEQLSKLTVGVSTESHAVAHLGAPTSRMRLASGEVMLQYVYAEAQVRPASFVPVVGLFAGGTDVRGNMVVLSFGVDGKLANTSSSASQLGTGTGFNAGAQSGQVPQQPRQ